jgi:predicted lipoprotein with Yx(FWY)xxD motif
MEEEHKMKRLPVLLLSFLGLIAAAVTGVAQSNTIQVKSNPDGVNYLTDAKGMTLYYYTKDADGQSACYGGCATAWPIFYSADISVSAPLQPSDFATITRTDGTKQTTYQGWPLYYWQKDTKPGDATGEGVGKVWYIQKVPAYNVMISTSASLGNYLVDGAGQTLYWYTKDSAGISACSGNCLKNWPAFDASSFIVPSALNPADFGTIKRDDGTLQATYKGFPLYYWVNDKKRGDTTGQDVGKVWYVIDPAKFPPAGRN